ncbi:MAG: signal recognition particle protein [Alphaproteobacteria bacterium]
MFQSLGDKLGNVFTKLGRKGRLSENDVKDALREIRVALLEADVALPVVKDFIASVSVRATGAEVLKSIKPDQMIVKIVHDALVHVLGSEDAETGLSLKAQPPVPVLMLGLQGVGKTTTTAKLAKYLTGKQKKKVLMASLDVKRPAAQEQLAVLGEQAVVATLPIIKGESPQKITKRAMKVAKTEGYDVVILDSAGRLHLDDELMQEMKDVADIAKPHETLLVADAMMGQDAVITAQAFHDKIGLTGIVLTRVDGDARGGAALSMKAVTGCPIKFVGLGEKLENLDVFDPTRVADRILGKGDVVGLVEKAAEVIEQDEAERLAKKMMSGKFDLEDMAAQLRQIRKLSGASGGLGALLGMMPGIGKMAKQLKNANMDEKEIIHKEAIISSMTSHERKNPNIIKARRKERIAKGSGTSVQVINKLLKQHLEMGKMMKQFNKMGGMKNLAGMMGGAAGAGPSAAAGAAGGMSPDLSKALSQLGKGGADMPDLPPDLLKNFKF